MVITIGVMVVYIRKKIVLAKAFALLSQIMFIHIGYSVLFRDGMPSLSSSYKISGLVPVCWLLFQCFVLKPAKLPKS